MVLKAFFLVDRYFAIKNQYFSQIYQIVNKYLALTSGFGMFLASFSGEEITNMILVSVLSDSEVIVNSMALTIWYQYSASS